jgi:hypothetical protein
MAMPPVVVVGVVGVGVGKMVARSSSMSSLFAAASWARLDADDAAEVRRGRCRSRAVGEPTDMGTEDERNVYLVWHTHTLEDGASDEKLLGVYSTEARANGRVSHAKNLCGFRASQSGFVVTRYVVDRDEWGEGFVTS